MEITIKNFFVVKNTISFLADDKLEGRGTGSKGEKIAASFTSVGLLSVYLNPLDALHGDIGVVREGDVVVLISNSGETSELLAIVPFLKKRAVKMLGILGKAKSTLGDHCDVVLDASVEREAAPIDQVPTSSTAVAMSLGDALAVAWMTEKGVSVSDFAMNHPGGTIGRRLTLTVADLMISREKLLMVQPDARLPEVVDALTTQAIGAVLVANPGNPSALGGIITDGDLRGLHPARRHQRDARRRVHHHQVRIHRLLQLRPGDEGERDG